MSDTATKSKPVQTVQRVNIAKHLEKTLEKTYKEVVRVMQISETGFRANWFLKPEYNDGRVQRSQFLRVRQTAEGLTVEPKAS